jgi:hypothetical protein
MKVLVHPEYGLTDDSESLFMPNTYFYIFIDQTILNLIIFNYYSKMKTTIRSTRIKKLWS